MFLGNLGNGLGEDKIGVFLSNDGGVTWTKVSDSPGCIEDGQCSCLLVR